MKNKYRNELNIINYITSTEKYKVIFFISVLLSIYGGFILGVSADNFFDSILIPLRFPIFNIFLFALIFINNINVCSIFKKNFPFYVSRLKNKIEYIKTMLRLSTIMYLFHMSIILLFLLASLFLTTFNNLEIYNYSNYYNSYEINNLIYCCFYCIRYLIFGLLIINISSLIYLNLNQKITMIINGIFLILMFYFGNIISMLDNYTINIWSYFTLTMFSSFTL